MKIKHLFLIALSALSISACKERSNQSVNEPQTAPANVVKILATTDLKDVEPLITQEIQAATGITLKWIWGGTMDNTEKVISGKHDADFAWFANAKYVLSDPDARQKVKQQEKIMLTPLVIGVFESDVKKWCWSH